MLQKTFLMVSFILLTACGLNPQHVDVDLNQTLPETKTTTFSQAILDLGKMSLIYGAETLHIMSKEVLDNTGTSIATKAEIPRDVTEMIKSALNGIGGNVRYIPYDPDFMVNTANTGYSDWGAKLLPHVLVAGGITEFDRSLVTKGENLDFDIEGSASGDTLGFEINDQRKSSVASITLDFNLIDFKTFAGIPRMQAINNIKVHKSLGEDTLGFTIYGATMGLKGSIKKIQGRHEAVRLLVQLSMIQIIGKYQNLPYWRLIPGGEPDALVTDSVIAAYYRLAPAERIAKVQEYLYLNGYSVDITGTMDSKTTQALAEFRTTHNLTARGNDLDADTYLAVYTSIPVDHITLSRKRTVDRLVQAYRGQGQKVKVAVANVERPLRVPANVTQSQPELNPGNLNLWANKTEFSIGDTLEVSFEVDSPMFVRIVAVNSNGKIATLFPNPHQPDNYCLPGTKYQIPPASAKFTLDVGGPVGTDKIRAIGGRQPVIAESMKLTQSGEFDPAKMANNVTRAGVDITIR